MRGLEPGSSGGNDLPAPSRIRVNRMHFDVPGYLATALQRYLDLHLRMRANPFRFSENAGYGVTQADVNVVGNRVMRIDRARLSNAAIAENGQVIRAIFNIGSRCKSA